MDYRYTNETDATANINITLGNLDTLIEILAPIAEDDTHDQRYRAANLNRELTEVRTRLIKQAHGYLQARADFLNK